MRQVKAKALRKKAEVMTRGNPEKSAMKKLYKRLKREHTRGH